MENWRIRKTKLAKERRGKQLQQREEHVTKAMVCLRGRETVSVARRGRVIHKGNREGTPGGEGTNSESIGRGSHGKTVFQRGGHGQESNAAERLRNTRTENIPWISQHAGHW